MKALKPFFSVVLVVLLVLSVVGLSLYPATTWKATQYGVQRYSQYEEMGLTEPQMEKAASVAWNYAVRGERSLLVDLAASQTSFAADALDHLADVRDVLYVVRVLVPIVAVLALVFSIGYALAYKKRSLGSVLTIAGAIPLVLFGVLGVFAAVDFDSFFTVFHKLLFADGTWEFAYDSLLIRLFPIDFWVYMGMIWLVGALILSFIFLISGLLMRRGGSSAHKTS